MNATLLLAVLLVFGLWWGWILEWARGVVPAGLPAMPKITLDGMTQPVSKLILGCDNRITVAAATNRLVGVFQGVQWTDTDGTPRFSNYWPTGTTLATHITITCDFPELWDRLATDPEEERRLFHVAITRAAAPIFSPSCGTTRMKAGGIIKRALKVFRAM